MYSKCAELESARKVFDEMPQRNVVTWNTMINGLAIKRAWRAGIAGKELIRAMPSEYKIKPRLEHYGCLVDLLGRCGRTREALVLIEGMPMRPTATIWGALLSACRNNGDAEVGERAATKLMEVEPENSGNFVLMANLYAETGRWEEAEKPFINSLSPANLDDGFKQLAVRPPAPTAACTSSWSSGACA
ncbi:hypothetical protein IEQ34_008716 [Dendrobium chrysotoxum]|uniref:Pentatricopeptide repeat-containing protein n=1 Tax=Dendrobium chrysotoxum TaxID=161865 RepID=A0AAV7GWS3_DENCH|nr:hypothetical protein IEQ34_008716 [Dendrobium chrysotoxum]